MLRLLLLALLLVVPACSSAPEEIAAVTTPPILPTQTSPPPSPAEGPPPTATAATDGATATVGDPSPSPSATAPQATATTAPPVEPTQPPATTPIPAPFVPVEGMVVLEPVLSGLNSPVGIAAAGDGTDRLFVIEQGGRVRVVRDGVLLAQPFLDISARLSRASEQGLLGLAFEPGRPERFYLNYTRGDGATIISRWRVDAGSDVADAGSEEILLTIAQPAANHNGGHLLFGPDGYLWIGMGDGGAAGDRFGHGQNRESLLGAMLRIDVRVESGYAIPADNPYVAGGGRLEIWAIGLRNPWRYAFDDESGMLWIADVGQNQWEEVNRVGARQAGLNYGWPILEASTCFSATRCDSSGTVLPITEYNHDFGCSITGGDVYRGSRYPALVGGYFFSDYCSGLIWAIPAAAAGPEAPEGGGTVAPVIVARSGERITSFGEDEAGELYLTAASGRLYRLAAP